MKDRDPEVWEIPMSTQQRVKAGSLVLLGVIITSILSLIAYLKTDDFRVGLIMFIMILAIMFSIERGQFMNFIKGKKLLIKGRVTWRREYCENHYDTRSLNSDRKIWHYWVYLGKYKLSVSETQYKTIQEGDFVTYLETKKWE